jgi:hypothetical protein
MEKYYDIMVKEIEIKNGENWLNKLHEKSGIKLKANKSLNINQLREKS